MNQEKIGKFILESRRARNLTQQELAQRLGVSDRTIGNWENGRNMPDLSLFKPLCEELNISVMDLISGEKINSKNDNQLEENILNTIDYSNKKIKKAKKIIIPKFIFLVTLCGIIMGLGLFNYLKKDSFANYDVELNYARVYLYGDAINNHIDNLKVGDKIDIFISEADVDYEALKVAYIENVEIKALINSDKTKDINYIILTLPNKYIGLTNALFTTSKIKVNVIKSKNQKAKLKINEKIYNLLDARYTVKSEE